MILGREKEKETLICCSTYLLIHWLILVCVLTGDETRNLGPLGQCSDQLSYLARARVSFLYEGHLKLMLNTLACFSLDCLVVCYRGPS